ncbi:MAG: mtnN [Pedosphaera sp.]|nr:mtnN [Pedosphaera sp.]
MGRRNAEVAVRKVLTQARPELVITAGFAGGLRPELKTGAVVFEEDAEAGLAAKLQGAGAVPARFYCAERVAITVAEKAAFWKSTGADAVEMESSAIRAICRELKIPSATVRVISDSAQEDLPLDFNALMTAGDRINYAKLFWTIARSPGKIASLMQFQKRTVAAARALGEVLRQSLGGGR